MATIKKNKKTSPAPKSGDKVVTKPSNPKNLKKKKKRALAEEQVDKVNINEAAEKAAKINDRDTKYIYPENCTTAKDKKDFRRKMRCESKALTAKLNRLEKSDKPEDKKAAKQTRKDLEALIETSFNPNKIPTLQ